MSDSSPLSRLFTHFKQKQGEVKLASLYSILNKIFDLAPPLLIGLAVDIVVNQEKTILNDLGFEGTMPQLYAVAVLTFLVWGFESLFEYAFGVKWRGLAQNIQHQLRLEAYSHIQKLEMSYFEDKSTGGLMAVLNDDINQLERFLDRGANDILQVATTVLVIGGIFFYLSPLVATFAFLPIPLILWGSFLYQRKIEPHYANVREEVSLLNHILSNSLGGMATVKSYHAENYERERLEKQSLSYARANENAIKLSSSFSPLIRMAVLMGFLSTLLIGGHLVETNVLAIGSYSVLIFMTQRLLWPLTRLAETFDLYQRAMASTRRVFSIIDTSPSIQDGKKDLKINQTAAKIELKNLSFKYPSSDLVLNDITLEVSPGQTAAIVGATGSGKSTLIKALQRFYEATSGEILINQQNVKEIKQKDLRSLMALVSQETYLFHGSVIENIRYGSFEKSDDEVYEAAKLAEAHQFIQELPNGYHTIVGERGLKLSGGQRQRLAIARAILKNAPIFIFDEATSAVDNETEAAIQRSLKKVTTDKTTIMIAHRLSTIIHAETIYVLDQGKIVESGNHQELLDKKGLYFSLWNVQTGMKE